MPMPDLNLLVTLDALLTEGSVAGAARRLRLSPSAMSRALTRLRETMGDPLLVRAGRGLVPTPRALGLRDEVARLVEAAGIVLRPVEVLDPGRLKRIFTLRTAEGFIENFAPALLARIEAQAPGVRLRFVPKPDRESAALRDGSVDLETGVIGRTTGPEVRVQTLFEDRFIGVVRPGHPLCQGKITPARFAAARHVLVSRQGQDRGVVDEALALLDLTRDVVTTVGSFSAALALVRTADLVVSVPERHSGILHAGLFSFALPVGIAPITISLMWHPRLEADPAHRWLRGCVHDACAAQPAG